MQRFYFDVQNSEFESDDVGVLCRNLDEVHSCAVRTATSIAAEEAISHEPYDIIVIARNEDGQTVLKTSLRIATN